MCDDAAKASRAHWPDLFRSPVSQLQASHPVQDSVAQQNACHPQQQPVTDQLMSFSKEMMLVSMQLHSCNVYIVTVKVPQCHTNAHSRSSCLF